MITVFATSGIPLVFIKTLQSLIQALDILPCFRSNRAFFAISLFLGVSLQSSVNYSKKAIKNHHGEVPVVVQKKKKKKKKKNIKHLQYKQENKTKTKNNNNNNNNKKKKLN